MVKVKLRFGRSGLAGARVTLIAKGNTNTGVASHSPIIQLDQLGNMSKDPCSRKQQKASSGDQTRAF